MSKRRIPGCFKYGCFSCLSVFALGVGLMLLAGAIQVATDQTPKPEQREASHELPPTDAVFPGTDAPEIPDVELPGQEGAPPAGRPAAGTLVLDLSMGEFTIRPGAADEPIRVEADYNANTFALKESFTEADDGSWTYDVRFGGKGGFLGMLFRGGGNASRNKVDIVVPRGRPIRIVGKVAMGESKIDLGGLWIQEVDLDTEMGDHFIEFREPTHEPIERFKIDGSMGSIEIRNLGEASPASVEVQHGMGELLLDLAGTWHNDAHVKVGFSMGECRLWVPDTVRLKVDASVALGERRVEARDESQLPADAPTITIDASGAMGEMRIEN